MSLAGQTTLRVVLYEGTGSHPLPAEERYSTISALLEKGFAVARSNGHGQPYSPQGGALLVIGRFENGVAPALEDASQRVGIESRDIGDMTREGIVEAAEAARKQSGAADPAQWKPWFPVIDYDRCTNCMQCLSFCLFGVYGVDSDRRIQAQNHDNCKTNCPACSRVCPEAAIMFPKYKAGPINGDVVRDEDLQREKMKVDISALLGGDVYSLLRDRSEKARSRFSKERDADKALKERQKCLTKLAQMGDIPPEVLLSLPSPEEIARRAEEAAARAKAAMA
ncbi:MAG TPA: ferredoxin family protein [Verrucomicrobiae bacterium]|nr:ferredoxin family protein [Verrucomicrobiae bacterium]